MTLSVEYKKLFEKLINERFHYFSRGVNEIWSERKEWENELTIADNIALFYKHPVYFFFTKK